MPKHSNHNRSRSGNCSMNHFCMSRWDVTTFLFWFFFFSFQELLVFMQHFRKTKNLFKKKKCKKGRGKKKHWHAAVHSNSFLWIIMWFSATIKASWKQQFVLESLLQQRNNKPCCAGSAISFVLPPPLIATLWICFVFHLPIWSMNKITTYASLPPDTLWWSPTPLICTGLRDGCAITWFILEHYGFIIKSVQTWMWS